MVLYNPKTGERIEEPNDYYNISVQFYTRGMKRKDANEFWNFMLSWEWSHDNELFWLQGFDPVTGKAEPKGISVRSWGLDERIKVLFEVFSRLFPGLEACANLRYGESQMLWDRGIDNHGGYLTVTLSNGKAAIDDVPII